MIFPRIEKIARDTAITHFLLMFGYKLFSLYFPLFLVSKGFSLPQVGWTFLLIYFPIALFAPLVSFLNHKFNPASLASLGILGYGVYALGMILNLSPVLFYFLQVILGVSASLFFVSSRAILMGVHLKNYDRAFGWFYSVPTYADAIAPAVGAFLIWKFSFSGVFALSLILQLFTALFCFACLNKESRGLVDGGFKFYQFKENSRKVIRKIKEKSILVPVLASFSVLLLGGFYHAFFILFLKDIGWNQNTILVFGSLVSLLFLPISLFVINLLGKQKSEKNVSRGGITAGFFTILLSIFPFLNFLTILFIILGKDAGALIAGSGRSGLLSQSLREIPEESGGMDTIFSPLGIALGSLAGGFLLGFFSYKFLFLFAGIFVLFMSILGEFFLKEKN